MEKQWSNEHSNHVWIDSWRRNLVTAHRVAWMDSLHCTVVGWWRNLWWFCFARDFGVTVIHTCCMHHTAFGNELFTRFKCHTLIDDASRLHSDGEVFFFFMFPGIYANSLLFHCTNDERDTRATFQLKLESPTTTHIRTWKYIYMLCRKMMHSTAAVQLYHQHAIKYGLIFIDCCRSLFFCCSSTRACLTVYIRKHFDYTYKLLFGVNSSH